MYMHIFLQLCIDIPRLLRLGVGLIPPLVKFLETPTSVFQLAFHAKYLTASVDFLKKKKKKSFVKSCLLYTSPSPRD